MDILVIGGTIFVGRHIVEAALERGHKVTLFNRGRENPGLFEERTEQLIGDRTQGLEELKGKNWDVVIDTSAYLPKVVSKSAQLLQASCNQYVFISTGSVYKDKSQYGIKEDAELEVPRNFDADEMTDETYGELKAGCERVVQDVYHERALIIRPGVIVGLHDPSDRFTYWPVRIKAGGKVLSPGNPKRPVQFIDARDLAEWTISMIERNVTGIFNAIGPDYSLSFERFLNECKSATESSAELVWLSEEKLLSTDVNRFTELPLWIPEKSDAAGFQTRDNSKAIACGLKFRPLKQTILDTLTWWNRDRAGTELKAGMSSERERLLLLL